ncbi:hypothetical protein Tco_0521725 [Tanacetum coccineum]
MSSHSSSKFKVFLVYEEFKCGVLLPNDITYSNLVRYVKKKFKVGDNNQICLSYNIGSNSINIIDDDDVLYFLNEVFESVDVVKSIFIKTFQQTLEVTRSSSSKPLDIDLNIPLFHEQVTHEWKKNTLKFIPTIPHAPTLDIKTQNKHNHDVELVEEYRFDDKEAYIYEIGFKCLKEWYEYKVVRSCKKRITTARRVSTIRRIKTRERIKMKIVYQDYLWDKYEIKSFLSYMRPLIIIDVAHLKGTYLGTNLVVVRMDGNNQIIPIATGVFQDQSFKKKVKSSHDPSRGNKGYQVHHESSTSANDLNNESQHEENRERGFEQTKECYLAEVIPFFKTVKEHFEGIQTALIKEVKEIKEIFEQMEAEVEQYVVDKKCAKIERKNLLIENENLLADCLSNELLYSIMNAANTVSRFSEMHDAYIVEQARIIELEAEISKLKHKIQKDDNSEMIKCFSNLEVNHLNLHLKYQHLKECFGNNKSHTSQDVSVFDSFYEINKMKEQLQDKNNTIRNLKVQISHIKERRSEADRNLDLRP